MFATIQQPGQIRSCHHRQLIKAVFLVGNSYAFTSCTCRLCSLFFSESCCHEKRMCSLVDTNLHESSQSSVIISLSLSHHTRTSSIHLRAGRPGCLSPSTIPNISVFDSRSSGSLQMWPNVLKGLKYCEFATHIRDVVEYFVPVQVQLQVQVPTSTSIAF